MPQMVWITRPDGWNTYFSQQWMDYTGLTLEESLGHGWLIRGVPVRDTAGAILKWFGTCTDIHDLKMAE